MSQSRNRFSEYQTYQDLSIGLCNMLEENELITFDELKTILKKIISFFSDKNPIEFNLRKIYINETFNRLNQKTSYKFWRVITREHDAQLPLLVTRLDQVIDLLGLLKPLSIAKDMYDEYFEKKFKGLNLEELFPNVPSILEPANGNDIEQPIFEIVPVTQRPNIPALVAQVFTDEKQAVIDSLSNLTEDEQLQLLNGVLYEVHNKRAILPVGFFSCFTGQDLDFSREPGVLSSVVNQHKEEEALSQFYDILSEESKASLISELISHAEQLTGSMLNFCVKNWSDRVLFNFNSTLTTSTIGAENQERSNQHPFVAFLSQYGNKVQWDSETFLVSYNKVPVDLYYLLTTVLRDCAYQDHIVLGSTVVQENSSNENEELEDADTQVEIVSPQRVDIISIDSVLNEENFSDDDAVKILACETSFVWMSPRWHEKAITSLWDYMMSSKFDFMFLQDAFFKQIDQLNSFEHRLVLLRCFLKHQSEALSNPSISFNNFQYLMLSPLANDLNRTRVVKLIARYARLSISDRNEFSTFVQTYLRPDTGFIASHYYGILMLHIVRSVNILCEEQTLAEDDKSLWKLIEQYVDDFQRNLSKLSSYHSVLTQGDVSVLIALLEKFKGNLSTPTAYLDVIKFVKESNKSGHSVDINIIRGLLYTKLAVCLQSMIHDKVDKKFTLPCFLVACCQASSDSSIAYAPYNRAAGITYENQETDNDDDTRSVLSSKSRLTSRTYDTRQTKQTRVSNVSQSTFYTQQSSSQQTGLKIKKFG